MCWASEPTVASSEKLDMPQERNSTPTTLSATRKNKFSRVEKRRDEEAIRAGFTGCEDVRYWVRGGNVPVHLLGRIFCATSRRDGVFGRRNVSHSEFASTSTAPTSPNRDADLESDDGDDIVGKVQDFLASENEGSESTDGSVAVGHSNVDRKRAVQTPSTKAKRIRPTLSSSMVDEIRGFRESGREELNVVRGMLAMDVQRPTVEALAIDLLHEAFDDILLEEELSFAYEVLECKVKAAQSVRMTCGEVWLRRQIAVKEREFRRAVAP
ncbi:hypothetical protein AaE_014701 [Aphanomyces astaci]|uniref:Uncharacterized protein n=2 Tax=Aphanomyces astaci TaxID=112090 RepID=A0A6A4Z2F5_APHAT|nr:hypothetical protein AaE_014701 [Aphanomyces astaci]